MPTPPMRPAREFDSDKNPIYICIPRRPDDKHVVKDFIVNQGRTNETFNGQIGPIFLTIPTPALRLKYKNEDLNGEPDTVEAIVEKLNNFIVPESKDYACTDMGRVEIAKLAQCIFKYKDRRPM